MRETPSPERLQSQLPRRNALIAMAAIIAAGLLFLVSNLDLPIVRNSFVYAKAAENIIAHGYNPLPVIADTNLSLGKPIAFSLLSVPLVSLFGANTGLKVASFLGTVFFLFVAYFFFVRLNRHAGIDRRFIPLELAVLFFSPLLLYQFWSAYPDSLFAGEVLLAFVMIDVIATEHERDTRALILLLGLVIYAAILTKLYGMILGLAVPLYGAFHLRSFLRRSVYVRSKIALFVFVFCALGVAVVLARLGKNPTLDFAADLRLGGGYAGYLAGLTNPSLGNLTGAIIIFILALVLNFSFLLFFLFRGGSRPRWPLAATCFAGLFLLGLLPFPGTDYNMRFFIPLFPFVVVAVVSGMQNTKKSAPKRWLLVAYASVAGFLILNYNLEPFYQRFRTFNEKVVDPVLDRHRRLDNLRLDQHVAFSRWIGRINRLIEPGGLLYWASRYYGTATHGVIEELGIRNDIVVRYAGTPSDIRPSGRTAHLAVFRSRGGLSELEDRFTVASLGAGVFRLVPLRVEIARRAEDDPIDPGELVPFTATASASAEARVLRVEFLIDGRPIAVDTAPPYEFNWHGSKEGRYVAAARAHDSMGNIALSAPLTVFVGMRALERLIVRSEDDAEEQADGSMYLSSSDLELVEADDDQVVGLRFEGIRIPRGTEIARAYLQFTVDEVSAKPTNLTIRAQLAGDAPAFSAVRNDVSSRQRTAASVEWSPEPWDVVGASSAKQRTPDLSALIGEVIARRDWQEGDALVFVITGSGKRVAVSYDGARERAPRLYIARR